MKLLHGIRNHALACAACALSFTAAGAQPAPAPAGSHQIVTGTICRVDAAAGTVELLTGVGHSIRVKKVRFATGVRVTSGRSDVGAAALVAGAICRVECAPAPSGTYDETATAIEILKPRTP